MPIEWSTSPEAIQNTDIVVGVVDNWIDDTKFVEGFVEAGKQVMLFFKVAIDPSNTIYGELEKVESFKKKNGTRSVCVDFNELTELCTLLNDQLERF